MSNVVQGNFKQVERNYGHKKITKQGVDHLQDLRNFLAYASNLTGDDQAMIQNMINEVLDEHIFDKHRMTFGDKEI